MRVSLGEGEGPDTSISFPAVPKFQFSLILWERNAKTDGLQMTKSGREIASAADEALW
jgi:hypothetical protein